MKRMVGVVIVCLSLIGCASVPHIRVNYGSLNNETFIAKSSNAEILLTTKDLDRPYKEIGIISASGKAKTTYDELNEAIKKKAREMGADAVIKLDYGTQAKAFMLPSTVAYGSMGAMVQQPVCKGIAVVFIEKK